MNRIFKKIFPLISLTCLLVFGHSLNAQDQAKTWSDWVSDNKTYPDVRIALKCNAIDNKHAQWQVMLGSTKVWDIDIRENGKTYLLHPFDSLTLAPIPAGNCSKQPHLKIIARKRGVKEYYALEFNKGTVKAQLKQPFDWNGFVETLAEVSTATMVAKTEADARNDEIKAQQQAAAAEQAAREQQQALQAAQLRVALAQQQAAQAQAQAAAAEQAAAQRQVAQQSSASSGSSSPPLTQRPQSQRPDMRVQNTGSQSGSVYSTGDVCSVGTGGPGAATVWAQDFQYSFWANQPARVSAVITLTDGSTHPRSATTSGGNYFDSFTLRLGCDYYAPYKLGISNVHLEASAQ